MTIFEHLPFTKKGFAHLFVKARSISLKSILYTVHTKQIQSRLIYIPRGRFQNFSAHLESYFGKILQGTVSLNLSHQLAFLDRVLCDSAFLLLGVSSEFSCLCLSFAYLPFDLCLSSIVIALVLGNPVCQCRFI